jgi:predicted phage replisome organizer
MAEYDKRRLYWIKLTDRFISSDTVDFLMSQKEGANYVVLYQMLCLKTVNNGGVLARELGEILVPYDADKIQRDCKWFSIDTVRVALELYKKLGLVYESDNGILAISDFDKMIGSQTYSAEKKALQREAHKTELLLGGQKVDNCPPYKDIYKEKEKDKDILIIESGKSTRFTPPTLEEVQAYCIERGNNVDAERFIDFYSSKGWMVGKNKMKDWKAAVRNWERTEPQKKESSFDLDDFFGAAMKHSYGG